ncbi:MAG: methylglyoxal synthase [Bacilli bacterium]|jgi:methylglyoxal synthase|nr:methylglyoxal synthase [Bacilli bacterium]
MAQKKKVLALIAHDNKKPEIVAWAKRNVERLKDYELCGTGHTAKLIQEAIGLPVKAFLPGPLGGDLEIGAAVAQKEIDIIVFLWDPLQVQPHDPDVKALLRIAAVYDIPIATNVSTADAII